MILPRRKLLIGSLATPFIARGALAGPTQLDIYPNTNPYGHPSTRRGLSNTDPFSLRGTLWLALDFSNPARPYDWANSQVFTGVNAPIADARFPNAPATWWKRANSTYAYSASQTAYNQTGPITLACYGYFPKGTSLTDYQNLLTKMVLYTESKQQPYVWYLDASGRQGLRRSGNTTGTNYYQGYDSSSADQRSAIKPTAYMVTQDGTLASGSTKFYTNGVLGTTTDINTAVGSPQSNSADIVTMAYKSQGSAPVDYSDWIGYIMFGWNYVFTAAQAAAWAQDPMRPFRRNLSPMAELFLGSGGVSATPRSRAVIIQ